MAARQPGPHGRIVTVTAARAGCGKTTLVTNMAAAIATRDRRVCVVDLDLTAGDAAPLLGVRPLHCVTEATAMSGELVSGAVTTLVTPVRPRLDAVLTRAVPGRTLSELVTVELLAGLARLYDYVVVDTPARFSGHVLAALDVAHHHVVAVTPDRPALRDLRLMLDMLDLLEGSAIPKSVVANRFDPFAGLGPDEIEQTVKCSVAASLPSTVDVVAAVNSGTPLVTAQPAHEYSRAVFRFVQEHITSVNEKGTTHA
ncbi:AAA family ATPase [Actinocrispum sp. NPDC049592]|uniref:AAA family ATPase n=1 Tax=Actinocrispum sp. NPDC049592 TaxID=3154835 RepID=UPI0034216932